MTEPRTEAEIAKYLEDFPTVAEIQRQLDANKRERQQLNQMLKISEQREGDEHPSRTAGQGAVASRIEPVTHGVYDALSVTDDIE